MKRLIYFRDGVLIKVREKINYNNKCLELKWEFDSSDIAFLYIFLQKQERADWFKQKFNFKIDKETTIKEINEHFSCETTFETDETKWHKVFPHKVIITITNKLNGIKNSYTITNKETEVNFELGNYNIEFIKENEEYQEYLNKFYWGNW